MKAKGGATGAPGNRGAKKKNPPPKKGGGREREVEEDDGDGGGGSVMVCLPVRVVTYILEGSSRVVRNHREQEQIRYRLLALMRPRIDQ